MNKKNQKGEVTTQQIVLLIILIASFAVILFFIFRLNLGSTSESEVCHNSVLMRGSKVVPGGSVPLNCQTKYVCITKDNTCEKMSGNFEKKKVSTDKETYEILANEMADCWWMFGEGKINYLGDELLTKMYCSLCSQLAFDDSMKEIFSSGEIDQKQLYEHLANNNVSGKDISYLEYLNGLSKAQEIESTLASSNSQFGRINFDKYYYVLMGATSKDSVLGWVGASALATAGAAVIIFTGGLGAPAVIAIGGGLIAGGVGGYFVGTTVVGESNQRYIPPTIIEANSEELNSLKCGSINTLA